MARKRIDAGRLSPLPVSMNFLPDSPRQCAEGADWATRLFTQLQIFGSRIASPAPLKSASRISEYLRDRITPGAPARNAAETACFTLWGVHLLWFDSVGMSMSMPGQI